MIAMAPFETFREHGERQRSDEPYSDDFINRCREKALEYDKSSKWFRISALKDLKQCVPMHCRGMVFSGIQMPD